MTYPEYAEIKGKRYKLNTDFRVALRCFGVIEDDTISDTERTLAIIYLLFGFIPKNDYDLFLEKATIFLQCGEKEQQPESERDMDLLADEPYITASFMSDYHIDLTTQNMHFWQYIDYIKGLTEKCVLSRVREIRSYDVSEVKDKKTVSKIMKAKESVALPVRLTPEEKQAIDDFENLFKQRG